MAPAEGCGSRRLRPVRREPGWPAALGGSPGPDRRLGPGGPDRQGHPDRAAGRVDLAERPPGTAGHGLWRPPFPGYGRRVTRTSTGLRVTFAGAALIRCGVP